MTEAKVNNKEWVVTQEAFDKLLSWLDTDQNIAGEKYEKIRNRLEKFFAYRGAPSPVDLADKVINRVTKRLFEGIDLPVSDPYIYFLGVAQNVMKEEWRNPERDPLNIENVPINQLPLTNPLDIERRTDQEAQLSINLTCLERCLSALPDESRILFSQYYIGEKRAKIDNREDLALRFGLSVNALRIRICRIRERLEHCVKGCVNSNWKKS